MRAFGRMGAQRHLLAMRNGIIATIPFVIVGATALLLISFPLGTDHYLKEYMPAIVNNMLLYIFRWSMAIMGLMAAWGIGSELGKTYKFSQTTTGLLGVFGFLMLYIPVNGSSISVGAMGGGAIFTAIIGAMAAVEIMHFCQRFNVTIKMPAGVPDAVANSFASLVPVVFIAIIFGSLRFLVGFNVTTFLADTLEPMKNFLVGGLGGGIVIILIVTMFWWVGIHGTSMIGSVIRPIWQDALSQNTKWHEGGQKGDMPFPVPEQFLQWFVWIGGAGATLGFIIAGLIFARSQQLKTITRVSAVPGLFNINEPVIFGTPIILNPFLLVPFILAPIAMAIVSYLLMIWFDVHMVLTTAWTLPAPVGAYFSSAADWKAIIIALISIGISIGIWTPFVIGYDRKLKREEDANAASKVKVLSAKELAEAKDKAKGKKAVA